MFGSIIKATREKKGWSQQYLSDQINGLYGEKVGVRSIRRYENSETRSPLDEAIFMIGALNNIGRKELLNWFSEFCGLEGDENE